MPKWHSKKPFRPRYESGEVVVFNTMTREGYIRSDRAYADGATVFFSQGDFRDGSSAPSEGLRVRYRIEWDGRSQCAKDISPEARIEDYLQLTEINRGRVDTVNLERNFGFIVVNNRIRVWFSFSALANPDVLPLRGDQVSFNLHKTPDGRLQADHVVIESFHNPDTGDKDGSDSVIRDTVPSNPASKWGQKVFQKSSPGVEFAAKHRHEKHENFLQLALEANRQGDFAQAERYYESGMEVSVSLHLVQSYAAWRRSRGEAEKAMSIYERGIRSLPRSARLYHDAGMLAASTGDYAKAIELLERGLATSPNDKGMLSELGRACFMLNTRESLEKSVAYYDEAIKRFGGWERFCHANPGAPLSGHAGNYNTAKRLLRGLEYPKHRSPRGGLTDATGLANRESGRKHDVAKTGRLRLGDQILAEALLAAQKGRPEDAEQLYEKGLRECATNALVMSYAAWNKDRGANEQAMRVYERGIGLFPFESKFYEDAGVFAAKLGDFDKAIAYLRKALELKPQLRQAALELAYAYYSKGDAVARVEAVKAYEAAASLYGTTSNFHNQLRKAPLAKHERAYFGAKLRQTRFGDFTWSFIHGAQLQIQSISPLDRWPGSFDIIVRDQTNNLATLYGLNPRLLVRCLNKSEVTPDDISELDDAVAATGKSGKPTDSRVALLFVPKLELDLKARLESRRETSNRPLPTIVPLDPVILQKLKQERTDKRLGEVQALRSVLNLWLHQRDLFNEVNPVHGTMFFGRTRFLEECLTSIQEGRFFGVFGLRKAGKTSLLKEIQRRLDVANHITVFFESQRVPAPDTNVSWVYQELRTALRSSVERQVGRPASWLCAPPGKTDASEQANSFANDIASILKMISEGQLKAVDGSKPKIVLLFDEIERLRSSVRGYHYVFANLRGLNQTHREIAVLMAGANPSIAEDARIEGMDNPIFNFIQVRYLTFFSLEECSQMLQELGRGMGVSFTPDALSQLHHLTGGHPFFARNLSSFVSKHHPARSLVVERQMLDELTELYLRADGGTNMAEIFVRLKEDYPEDLRICKALAQRPDGIPAAELPAICGNNPNAAAHIQGYQLTRMEGGVIRFHIDLFRQYLSYWHGQAATTPP